MTGCGEGVASAGGSSCRVELRTVNNRAFKFSLRAREGLVGLEPRAEEVVRRRVRRGTIHMGLDLSGPAAVATRRIDHVQLAAYLDELEDFCAGHDLAVPRSVDALLGLPGVTCDAAADSSALEAAWPLVAEALERALDALERMRRAEGRSLAAEIGRLVAAIRERVPQAVARHRERLQERVATLVAERGVTLAEADFAREVALVADRTDIAEELVRLESHLGQFRSLLAEESTGRQLDFLAQELAREANTVAAKSADVGIAHAVVEVKTLVDRLREQVQNLE
jgi:uncharacterized protein (TIGR00255 family)